MENSKKRLKSFFEKLDGLFETYKINPYVEISKEDIFKEVELEDEATLKEPLQFERALLQILAKFKIGHLSVENLPSEPIVPLSNENLFLGYEKGFFVLVENSKNGRKFWNVTEINGRKIEDVKEQMRTLVPEETPYTKEMYFSEMFINGAYFHMLKLDDENLLHLGCEDENGNTRTAEMGILSPRAKESESKTEQTEKTQNSRVESKQKSSRLYDYEILDGGVLKINYNLCRDDANYPFSEFESDIEKLYAEGKFSSYILNLRLNRGGSDVVIAPLFNFLKENNVFGVVLTGEKTFSSAVLNAAKFREKLGAKIVGTPSAGNVNGFGIVKKFEIEGVEMWVPTAFVDPADTYGCPPDIVIPDVMPTWTFKDYTAPTDKDVDTALTLIEKHNKSAHKTLNKL